MSTKEAVNPKSTLKAIQEFEGLRDQYLSILCQPLTRGSSAVFTTDQKKETMKTTEDKALMFRFGSIAANLVFQYVQKCLRKDSFVNDDDLVSHAMYYCYLNHCLVINVPPVCSIDFFIDLVDKSKYTPTLDAEITRFQRTYAVNDLANLQWKQVEKTLNSFEMPRLPHTDTSFIAEAKGAIAEYRNQLGLWKTKSSDRLDIHG